MAHRGIGARPRKKAKAVSGNSQKLKKLAELKKVNAELDKRFTVSDKLFTKQQKLKEQLGISS